MLNHMPNTIFRMYQNENSKYKSSLFDLIDGTHETKQTKGLAYLLSLSARFLNDFLSINKVQKAIKESLSTSEYLDFLDSEFVTVDAEMTSITEKRIRRDITLSFFNKNRKALVLVIEAKSIKSEFNQDLEKQMHRYVDSKFFPNDEGIPKFAVALTKYTYPFQTSNFASLTWIEVIHILHRIIKLSLDTTNLLIVRDYYQFITGVDKNMNYFEKEILSVPAGKTFMEINKYQVHACPNTPSYNYRDPLFITFRQKNGGVMNRLYKIEEILILPPANQAVLNDVLKSSMPYKERLLAYIIDRKKGHGFKSNDTYKFYILSETEHISLPHNPHPEKNNAGPRYYTLAEMLSGKSIIVTDTK
ncbi:hypothetical protein ABN702_15945 [Bacillus haimaensis]|uniref:hypothetical protein n=1 Tax=Bacillus haimaensis TaxID=3160967 RepID=UPI003AA90E6D